MTGEAPKRRPAWIERALSRLGHHMLEILHGSSVALALRIGGAALALVFNLVLTRLLGAGGAGIYFLALTIVTIATLVGRMGMDNALLRLVAGSVARSDWGRTRGVYRTSMVMAALFAGAATFVLIPAAPFTARRIFSEPGLQRPLQVMALAIVPMTLALLHGEALKGVRKIGISQFVQWGSLHLFNIALIYPLVRLWGVSGAAASYAIAAGLTFTIGRVSWRRVPGLRTHAIVPYDRRALLRDSTPLFWIASINMLASWIGLIILGILGTSSDVGIFGVATRLSVVISFVLVAVNAVAAPKFAALHQKGDMESMRHVAVGSTRLMVGLALPVLLLFVFASRQAMGLFGPEFEAGWRALVILSVGQFLVVCAGSAVHLLMMTGRERTVRNLLGLSVAIGVALNLLLVPTYGIEGAAVATALSLVAINGGGAVAVWRRYGILTLPIGRTDGSVD